MLKNIEWILGALSAGAPTKEAESADEEKAENAGFRHTLHTLHTCTRRQIGTIKGCTTGGG